MLLKINFALVSDARVCTETQTSRLHDASIQMFSSICLVFSRCFWSLIKPFVYTKEDVLSYGTCRRCKNLLYVKRSRHVWFLISWQFERSVWKLNMNILAEKLSVPFPFLFSLKVNYSCHWLAESLLQVFWLTCVGRSQIHKCQDCHTDRCDSQGTYFTDICQLAETENHHL